MGNAFISAELYMSIGLKYSSAAQLSPGAVKLQTIKRNPPNVHLLITNIQKQSFHTFLLKSQEEYLPALAGP